ncbi:MAG: hypothetical protein U1E73_05790 [Planctomycetota bacterium]
MALLGLDASAQNPDRGYVVGQFLNQANIGAFALDSYVGPAGTILYAGDFRTSNSIWKITNGNPATATLVVSGFGSGSLSIGDMVVDQQRHLLYAYDASHGAIYSIDPTVNPAHVQAIATQPQWVTAFGNGGIDINPVDGNLYLLTPGNSPTGGGGLYRIGIGSPMFPVTQMVPNIAAQFAAMGGDVRPDVLHFDCSGRLWGSARDLADLTNRPSILYKIDSPFSNVTVVDTVMIDPNIGTISDLEFDPMTRDIFLSASERGALLRFNTDWFDYNGTLSTVEVVSSFANRCQGIAVAPGWTNHHGNGVFVATNSASHTTRIVVPSDLYEVGPFFVTDDAIAKRCPSINDKTARMRGVLPGMIGWSLATDPVQERLFVLGKTSGLDIIPGAYRLEKDPLNQVFSTDFVGIALGYGSGACNRGDLFFSEWQYKAPVNLFPQPIGNDVFRVYLRDEVDGWVLEVDPDQENSELPKAVHYRPEPTDVGGEFYNRDDRGAMAIGPDQGLWVVTKEPSTNTLQVERLLRQNHTDRPLVEIEAYGTNSGIPNTTLGFWRVTQNMGRPADRGSPIVDVRFDFTTSINPQHSSVYFDTDQVGMLDYFDAGNHNVPGCDGTYRQDSDVSTGLIYDYQNTAPLTPCAAGANTGWIGSSGLGSGNYRALRFRFAPNQFMNETFSFDCDTDGGAGGNGGDMAGMAVRVALQDGRVFQGWMVADPIDPNRSVALFTDQTVKNTFTPNPAVVLGANEQIDDLEVSWLGDLYLLVVDDTVPVSKLVKFNPVRGTMQVLHTIQERINDFAFYEVLDTGPIQYLHNGPQYFLFASSLGHVLKWNPVTDVQSVLIDGFRFAVTTLAFGKPWHGSGPTSLFVMTGAENPQFAEFFEIGPADRNGFLEQQTRVSVLPEATRGRGGVSPFLRVEGMPEGGQSRDFVLRWADPDGMNIGGLAGSLAFMIGGLTEYPGNYYLPGLFVPLSQFPVAAITCTVGDPNGPSMLPGAGVGRARIGMPPLVQGDFVLQAVVLDLHPSSSLTNTWTLSNPIRVQF